MTTPVLFLDDASRHVGICSRDMAEQLTTTLLATLKALRHINKRFALSTAVPIAQYQIADDWTLQSILTGNARREEWDFIRQLSNRSPFAAGMEECLRQEIDSIEFRTQVHRVRSNALAWAALVETATVSVSAHPDWSLSWIDSEFVLLEDDGTLTQSQCRVRNASQVAHVTDHVDWLKWLGLAEDPTASEVWKERLDRYPGLRFLPRVENDLVKLQGSGAAYRQALGALDSLTQDVANWKPDCAWPDFSTKDSNEGEQRQKLCWVHDDVTGKKECFSWHTRFTGAFAGRVHFRVDEAAHKIVIAYIGGKLSKEIVSS
ncbi:hypothetical protein [Niveibacterium microcysteis]|uniref:Uncharacterized protein n=1 Tax=Niveibacterium microcysteis TaxID=2811415 RepID=A0ABX7M6N7_9RHOO|nr:hypothetical protein [Niveibacterium microcysteis]QSI76354.1 hypothetical protein JY500_18085 [Niveibacterium microcysteis]